MKKGIRKVFMLLCACMVCGGIVSSVHAVYKSQTKSVTGGTITAYAQYQSSGNTRWDWYYAGSVNNYSNVMSVSVRTNSYTALETSLTLNAQLMVTGYDYNTTALGTAKFVFNK